MKNRIHKDERKYISDCSNIKQPNCAFGMHKKSWITLKYSHKHAIEMVLSRAVTLHIQ